MINRVTNTQRVASSAVEHSAFNRMVLGSNPRRPIKCVDISPVFIFIDHQQDDDEE